MRLRELKSGVQLSPELRIDSPLDSHNGIALYLATDSVKGHMLVHVLSGVAPESHQRLQDAAIFYRSTYRSDVCCGCNDELLYFCEPFPLGEFMYEWLERRERIKVSEAIKRVISVLKDLQTAHDRGVYHGRITPKSILLERTKTSYALRLMGLGVAQALPDTIRYDIDWLDYTFDLEGMSPVAVDIYGMAIVLMGLVSGEAGIDSFEATGLLPPSLRGGLLQQTMERALALRMDTYSNVFSFCLDLEASLLELDDRQGEVYVGNLVGFESAVRSISTIAPDEKRSGEKEEWSSMFDTLEQEERSSILCSLTSLTAIPPVPAAMGDTDEDEDVTCVTSMPSMMTSMNRIKSVHVHDAGLSHESASTDDEGETTNVSQRPNPSSMDINSAPEVPAVEKTIQMLDSLTSDDARRPEISGSSNSEDDEDAPTRVMMRPNYSSISFEEEHQSAEATIADVISSEIEEPEPPSMEKRIREAEVILADHSVGHDVMYDPNDPVAFPPEDEPENAVPAAEGAESVPAKPRHRAVAESAEADEEFQLTNKHKIILFSLVGVAVILAIFLAIHLLGQTN